ncbi:hypothetical protein cyc_05589 [Cyclospora cayetanensis]|uniref:Uncharacterized protein n=1 Tax=Cyclospora cayetanensis TaxID=88456 RepID=A0A1D3CR60_9EIME|nr:hypothetical protein cyc_05589 [Cyclospora cayetanensis]
MDKGGLEASADEEVQVLVGESQDGTVTTFLAEAGNPPAAAVELPPTKRTSGAVVASDVVSPAKKASRTAEAEAEAAEDIEDVLWDAPFAVPATPPIGILPVAREEENASLCFPSSHPHPWLCFVVFAPLPASPSSLLLTRLPSVTTLLATALRACLL